MEPRIAVAMTRYAALLDNAGHGQKSAVVKTACAELVISINTFYTLLEEIRPTGRKGRADRGSTGLRLDEAKILSAYMMEGYRMNGKRKAIPLYKAVEVLRDNGQIMAANIDPETGEIKYLSLSAISRALKQFNLHPEQLRVPEPSNRLKTDHPNHLWQVDGSVCILYYLPDGTQHIEELDEGKHYKNKQHNLKAIEQFRVIRYVVTDHTTNVTRFKYYPHAESAEHSVRFLCWAMAPKDNPSDPFHGRPKVLYVDPGATAGGLIQRMCLRMGIEFRKHKPRNAKATGSVENGQWRVESLFEQGLRFQRQRIQSFDDLNRLAEVWQLHYNATAKVGRHKMSRFEAWMHIRAEQLIVTQPAEVLLDLATRDPEARQVTSNLTVHFEGKVWDVREVPGVMVKGTVYVHRHPFRGCAMAVVEDIEGRETHIELTDVTGEVDPQNGLWGFQANANPVGTFNAQADTLGERHKKEIALLASESKTHEEDQKKRRKTKEYTPFDGKVNPFKTAETAELPTYINKRGTALDIPAPRVETVPLTAVHAAKLLMPRLGAAGVEWTAEHMQTLRSRYPNGVPEGDLDALRDEFAGVISHKPKLALVK